MHCHGDRNSSFFDFKKYCRVHLMINIVDVHQIRFEIIKQRFYFAMRLERIEHPENAFYFFPCGKFFIVPNW